MLKIYNTKLVPLIKGIGPFNQITVDTTIFKLVHLLKKILGVYIILGVLFIVAKAADKYLNVSIYINLGGIMIKLFLLLVWKLLIVEHMLI